MKLHHFAMLMLALGASATEAANPGESAPSCKLPALSGGAQVDPAALSGKVVYLDFWASWCGPCAKAFPFLEALHQDLKARGLEVVAVNLDEDLQEAKDFLARHPASFTIGSDPKGSCPSAYGVKGMPTSYLIDRQGRVHDVHEGFQTSDVDERREQVEALLAKP